MDHNSPMKTPKGATKSKPHVSRNKMVAGNKLALGKGKPRKKDDEPQQEKSAAQTLGELVGQLMLRAPNDLGIPAGPVPHAAMRGLVGAGAGYLGAHAYNKARDLLGYNKDKYGRSTEVGKLKPWQIAAAGGGLGVASSALDIYTQHKLANRGKLPEGSPHWAINPYPYSKPPQQVKQGSLTMTPLDPVAPGSFGTALAPYAMTGLGSEDLSVGISQSMGAIYADTSLNPVQKTQAIGLIRSASNGKKSGLISTADIVRAGIGAGLGYGAASIAGKVLGATMSMPTPTQRKLSRIGALGGMLKATGIWG